MPLKSETSKKSSKRLKHKPRQKSAEKSYDANAQVFRTSLRIPKDYEYVRSRKRITRKQYEGLTSW